MTKVIVPPTLEEMQRQIAKLEKRVERLESERDEARVNVVRNRIGDVVRNMYLFRGQYLPSESIRLIRLGKMTLERAVAERNEQEPIINWRSTMTLKQAYLVSV